MRPNREFRFMRTEVMLSIGIEPYYWTAGQGQSEVDFIIQEAMNIIPVETKAEVNLMAKSLKVYCQKYLPPVAIRTSMSDHYRQTVKISPQEKYTLIDLPLYGISQIRHECE